MQSALPAESAEQELRQLFTGMTGPQPSSTAKLVKPVQFRGSGMSCVLLDERAHWDGGSGQVYVKRQRNYTCRPAWRAYRRTPTLAREHRALQALHQIGLNVPEIVSYRQSGFDAELVIAEIEGGIPLSDALARPDVDRQKILTNAARLIRVLHTAGWTHGALNAEHIFVQPEHGFDAALIDLEKARRNRHRSGADLERIWRRNPELTSEDRAVFELAYRS